MNGRRQNLGACGYLILGNEVEQTRIRDGVNLLRFSSVKKAPTFTAGSPRRVFGKRDRCAKDPRAGRALKGLV